MLKSTCKYCKLPITARQNGSLWVYDGYSSVCDNTKWPWQPIRHKPGTQITTADVVVPVVISNNPTRGYPSVALVVPIAWAIVVLILILVLL
jgi:hypothetical protein